MTVVFPDAVKAQGAISVTAIAVADLTTPTAPKLSDLTSDGVNISMYLYTGSAAPSSTTTTGEAPRRLGSKQVTQEMGTTNHAIGDLQYVHDPQASAGDPANAAKTLLTEGDEFYLVYRYGPDGEDALAIGDKVNVWKVQVGPQNEGATGDGEFDHLSITQSVIAKAPPTKGVALVA
jgi:hypothetical protein